MPPDRSTPAGSARTGLTRLLDPRSIALIGASPDTAKLPGRPLAYLKRYGFSGAIYPVNPRYREIDGLACHASIADLPEGIDLALILLGASGVCEALEQCGQRGIPFAISIAGGFAEAGDHASQARLAEICERYSIQLIGPNCLGLMTPRSGLTATFSSVLREAMPRPGSVVLLTQSGALGNAMLQSFLAHDIGVHAWVSTGNEVSLGVLDLLEHVIEDDSAGLVLLFVEALRDGARLLPLARRALARGKPVVMLRTGLSQMGRAASVSHTGKLAGAPAVWRDVIRQAGVIEAHDLDDLAAQAQLHECGALLLPEAGTQAERVARVRAAGAIGVVSASGGQGVMIADSATAAGLSLPAFAESVQRELRAMLPPQMPVTNPVDTALFADGLALERCCRAVMADPSIGTLVLTVSSFANDYEAMIDWLCDLGRSARDQGRLLALTYLSSSDRMPVGLRRRLQQAGVLEMPTQQRIIAVLGRRRAWWARVMAMREAAGGLPSATAASLPGEASRRSPARSFEAWSGQALSDSRQPEGAQDDAVGFIQRAGIPLVSERLCQSLDEAVAAGGSLGFPLVLKVASPDIAHKTEVGGVALDIVDEPSLGRAWRTMVETVSVRAPEARIEGYVVQPQLRGGLELIVGCSIDAELGRVLMVGAGGIWAELIEDRVFIGLPATQDEIREALSCLKLMAVLRGARGGPEMDIEATLALIDRLGKQFVAETWVAEVDINPLLVRPRGQGVVALDSLVVARR